MIVSTVISIILIIKPYEIKLTYEEIFSHSLLNHLIPDERNFYLDPFWALNLFIPSVIVGLSFFWKFPLSSVKKLMFSGLLLISLFVSFYYIMMDSGSGNYEETVILNLISYYNLFSMLWLLLLVLPIKERIPLIHWPFDEKK